MKHDEDLVKEFDSLDGRHNKASKTLADRFSSVFNKKTKQSVDGSSTHGGDTSPSRFCDRLVTTELKLIAVFWMLDQSYRRCHSIYDVCKVTI